MTLCGQPNTKFFMQLAAQDGRSTQHSNRQSLDKWQQGWLADIVWQHVFGPVLAVSVFDDEDDAVAQANSTRFGLASGLFTRDIGRTSRMVKRIRAGIVWVNTYRVIAPSMPFGGYGDTGYGREGGVASIYDYLRTKSVWIYTSDEPIGDPFVMR